MLAIEILLFVGTIAVLVGTMYRQIIPQRVQALLLNLVVLMMAIHIILGASRWQFYPLYVVLVLVSFVWYLRSVRTITITKWMRLVTIIVSTVGMLLSLVAIFVFPTYQIPEPSGGYAIGTESFVIHDSSRLEDYTELESDTRSVKIQLWYPAQGTNGFERAPWLEDGVEISRALSRDTGLPFFVLDQTADIVSNSYHLAPISTALDEYPVVVISHGWRGFRNLHTDFAEELASQGYIVVAIDHTYGSVATVFDEDTIAYVNYDALPDRDSTEDFLDYANQLVFTYAGDVSATLDYLEDLNSGSVMSQFTGVFDLSNIGLLGHSTGGGGDVAVALEDNRITSLIGLDAWVESIDSDALDLGLSIPSLFLRSGAWEESYNNEQLYQLIDASTVPPLFYQIDGTTHYDFAMVYMYSPLTPYVGFTGSVDNEELTLILKQMINAFFDQTLRDQPTSELDQWDEVRPIATPTNLE